VATAAENRRVDRMAWIGRSDDAVDLDGAVVDRESISTFFPPDSNIHL
jgi:hypothetical protein